MSLNLDRSTWKRVKLGDVVVRSRTQVDPFAVGIDRYVAGGHIDTDSAIIQRSGDVADGQMGSTFRYLFKPGQVLFVSARPYLRKSGVPDFSGVVADKTYVLNATPGNGLLNDMLPFLLKSDRFVEYATQEATGSMNPRLLWGAMQRYEFDLPSIEEQKRIAHLLWAMETNQRSQEKLNEEISKVSNALFTDTARQAPVTSLSSWVTRIDAGRSPQAAWEPAGKDSFGVLKVSAVGRDAFVPSENKRLLDKEGFHSEYSVHAGDLLVTRANAVVDNVARPCLVDRDYPNLMLSDKTLRLVPAKGYPNRVILAALRAPAYRAYVREVVNGTEAKNISQQRILAGPVPDLHSETIRFLLDKLTAIDAAANAAARQLAGLLTLKSATLSDVFRGN